jgi:hypothetical protein
MKIIENPTREDLFQYLNMNKYLIKDGHGVGEGIVIKNYNFFNQYGRQTWAKIINDEFKNKTVKKIRNINLTENVIETKIVSKYVTKSLVEKEYAKIVTESDGWSSKYIHRLLNTVFHCLITEESWNFVKEFKNPTINFKILNSISNQRVKELTPELF